MGKGNDPNCVQGKMLAFTPDTGADLPDTAGQQRRAFALQEHRRQHERWLQEPLGPEWGLWEKHVEPMTGASVRAEWQALTHTMTQLLPDDVKVVRGGGLNAEQQHAVSAGRDTQPRPDDRWYLAVRLTDPATAQMTGAVAALIQFEEGAGPAAQRIREARMFGRVQQIRDRIRIRCLKRVPGFLPEDELPADWMDQLIYLLKHEQISEYEDFNRGGTMRRSMGVHQWGSDVLSEETLQLAGRKLGFVVHDAPRASRF